MFFDIRGYINPVALIKAKIVYNFGLLECSRVTISKFKILSTVCLLYHTQTSIDSLHSFRYHIFLTILFFRWKHFYGYLLPKLR